MTSKERVLTAISHKEPDRVPVGEWEYGKKFVESVLKRKALLFSDIDTVKAYWQGRRDEIIEQRKKAKVELVQRLNWDAVLVHLVIGKETAIEIPEQIDDRNWRYKDGSILRYSEETGRFLIIKRGSSPEGVDDAGAWDVSKQEPVESELEVIRYVVKELGKTHFIFSVPLIRHPKLRFSDASISEVENWVKLYEDSERCRDEFLKYVNSAVIRRGIEIAK